MKKEFIEYMGLEKKSEQDVKLIPPLVLAYVGDAIYEGYIRTYILHKYGGSVNTLHRLATKFVKAGAQSKIVHAIFSSLSESEWIIVKKGRNQKSGSVPKNANLTDYKYATGFETLIGYLYMMGKSDRIEEIVKMGIDIIENEDA